VAASASAAKATAGLCHAPRRFPTKIDRINLDSFPLTA
jgi:hypothetical protein